MEHNKEVFFEEKKLEQVLYILEIETLNYITKRKYITEYILEARKKYIEEYKDDEDQVIQYFDHENYIKEEYYKMIDKRLKEIVILKDSPYFGKITFSEDELTPLKKEIEKYKTLIVILGAETVFVILVLIIILISSIIKKGKRKKLAKEQLKLQKEFEENKKESEETKKTKKKKLKEEEE